MNKYLILNAAVTATALTVAISVLVVDKYINKHVKNNVLSEYSF